MSEQNPAPAETPPAGEAAATSTLPEGVELRPESSPGVERVRVFLSGKPQGAVYRRRDRGGAGIGRWSILGEEKPVYATSEQAALTLLHRGRPK